MIRILLSALLCSILYVPFTSSAVSQGTVLSTPVQVVAAFQKFPDYEMFCEDATLADWEPVKVGTKFETYLSKELYKLFLWSQCRYPNTPPFYGELDNLIFFDIRYGNSQGAGGTHPATNIRIQFVKHQGADKAIVKVLFDPLLYDLKNITTIYTLIREDGHWKIDDIAPKGVVPEEGEDEEVVADQQQLLENSESIKTDMQNNYRAAEERYKQEQAKKGTAPKP
ncbi:MAG: hypothetical protein KKH12_05945 [Gammaproteobacteria bacterium]|nr:hypothetical protein [Gammaproteobacteria bacterium]